MWIYLLDAALSDFFVVKFLLEKLQFDSTIDFNRLFLSPILHEQENMVLQGECL